MLRAARTLGVLATILVPLACQTVQDPLPPQAALNFDITDSALSSQRAPLPAPQVATWRVEELTATNVVGFEGTYSFLFSGPCSYQLNAAAPVPFVNACRTSGLTLKPGTITPAASFRMTISRLEIRAASRPDLTATADPDGDGIPNSNDNCPMCRMRSRRTSMPRPRALRSAMPVRSSTRAISERSGIRIWTV